MAITGFMHSINDLEYARCIGFFCGLCSAVLVGMGAKRPHTWFIMEFGKYWKIMKKPMS